jgi:hypothetical protein
MRRTDVPLAAVFVALVLALAEAPPDARGEEGLWPLDAVPLDAVEKAYGFKPGKEQLDRMRASSLRLGGGCSASFVSSQGLAQTSHRCAAKCIDNLSSKEKNYLADGFYAREFADELQCSGMEADQLLETADVTERMIRTIEGKDGAAFAEAERAERTAIVGECAKGDADVRCDVVPLYPGAVYKLYKYRRHRDVRLVFAPEQSVAFFGGNLDSFEFPRYNFDVAYLRLYTEGRPLDTDNAYLPYARMDARPGDPTLAVGHPEATHRLSTLAELNELRDRILPARLVGLAHWRGVLSGFAARGAEEDRISAWRRAATETALKAMEGRRAALIDPVIMAVNARREEELRQKVEADPELKARCADAWENIRKTLELSRDLRDRYAYLERGEGFNSHLFRSAKALARNAAEALKPDEARLEDYTDARFPAIREALLAPVPIHPELEKLQLAFSLTRLREAFGPDDPFVRKILAGKTPDHLAAELVDGSALGDVAVRLQLLQGGQAAIEASTDPMIVFARALDGDMRAVRRDYEERVAAPLARNSGAIAWARLKIEGAALYPDATSTLRLSFGVVKGYRWMGAEVAPDVTLGAVFERATGVEPFVLPQSWLIAEPQLHKDQVVNFITTNDGAGRNSGAAVINKAGETVGVVSDSAARFLGATFFYDGDADRTVAVSVGALREALIRIYHTDRIVEELAK